MRKFRKNYQAISKLLDNNERISFGAIAKEANVSVIYLYKYHEVKKHIQEIRAEQVKEARKLTRLQTVRQISKYWQNCLTCCLVGLIL